MTITDGSGVAAVPAVPVIAVALFAAIVAAAPAPTVTCNDDAAYCIDVFTPSTVAVTLYTADLAYVDLQRRGLVVTDTDEESARRTECAA